MKLRTKLPVVFLFISLAVCAEEVPSWLTNTVADYSITGSYGLTSKSEVNAKGQFKFDYDEVLEAGKLTSTISNFEINIDGST